MIYCLAGESDILLSRKFDRQSHVNLKCQLRVYGVFAVLSALKQAIQGAVPDLWARLL